MCPSLPVILVEGVLNRDNGVLLDVAQIEIGKFHARDPLARVRVGVLEVEIIFTLLVKFRGSDVEGDFDLPLVACLFDGFREEFE